MRKTISLSLIMILFAGILSACNLPAKAENVPGTLTEQPASVQPAVSTDSPQLVTPAPTEQAVLAPTATRVPGSPIMLDQIHMLTSNDGWGWASKDGEMTELLRTGDGGQTWMDVSPQGKYSYYDSFFLDTQTAWLTFYDSANNNGGLLHTKDGGKTWASLPPNDNLQNARVKFTSPTDGLAATAGLGAGNAYLNYYQTTDEGASWSVIPLVAPTAETGLPVGTIHLCNICGDALYYDPQRAIITYGDMASDPVGVVRLSVSTNLGQQWTSLQLPLPDKYSAGSVSPQSPTFFGEVGIMPVNIFQYNADGSMGFSVLVVYTSQDSGQTWQAAPGILENQLAQVDVVQILSAKEAFVRCGKDLCSTNDGAQTWRTLPASFNFDQSAAGTDYVNQYNFIDPSNGWAITGQSGATTELWQTKDGGVTWTKLAPTLVK